MLYNDGRIKTPMLLWLISDCKKALDAGAYIAALCIALMLPDVCNKVNGQFKPGEAGKRYKEWVDNYIGVYGDDSECDLNPPLQYPCAGGDEIYKLRCALLHEGLPNVDISGMNITFVIDEKSHYGRNGESYGITYSRNENGEYLIHQKNIRINIRHFCVYMCNTAEEYYRSNQEFFNSQQSEIINFNNFGIRTEKITSQDIDEAIHMLYEKNLGDNL